MIIEDKALDIDGTEYRIQPFPAFKGLVILKKLTKIIGPSFSVFLDGGESSGGTEKAVELLVDNFDDDKVENLVKELISSVTKNGQSINFDIEFMGAYDKLFVLIKEVVMVNFGSVFQLGGFQLK